MATATPPQDEPRSPLWLPALGAALFLLGGIWWLAAGDEPKPAPSAEEMASASAAAAASAAPAGADAGAAPQAAPH